MEVLHCPVAPQPIKENQMDEESLAHTKWNCKYHIVFAPKSKSFDFGQKTI